MIFSRALAFLHVPKTAGMSLTSYLLENLPKPVYYTGPPLGKDFLPGGVIRLEGARHETLTEAVEILQRHGLDIRTIPVILAVVRNPYAIEVSRYGYLQLGHPWDAGHSQDLALTQDFEVFAKESGYHAAGRPLEAYYLLDGEVPANLRILRYENLADELAAALREAGVEPRGELPWVNRSTHEHHLRYYTPAAERAVYEKYRWVFDAGLYPRLSPRDLPTRPTVGLGRVVPAVGPIARVESVAGMWPDGWVERRLSFNVETTAPIVAVTLSGILPPRLSRQVLDVDVGDRHAVVELVGGEFDWTMDLGRLGPGPTAVWIRARHIVSPSEVGASPDKRQLAFQLRRLRFNTGLPSAEPQVRASSNAAVGE